MLIFLVPGLLTLFAVGFIAGKCRWPAMLSAATALVMTGLLLRPAINDPSLVKAGVMVGMASLVTLLVAMSTAKVGKPERR